MNCPKCTGAELRRGKLRGSEVELDGCQSCGGLWFDGGELGAVLGPVAAERAQIPPHARANERLRCPRCGQALVWFCFPGTMTVVDACRGCQGVWLDGGEVKSLKAALDAPADEMACPKCGARQPTAESCARCGIVIARYHPGAAPSGPAPVARRPGPAPVRGEGIKERLLRFIDSAIASLTS